MQGLGGVMDYVLDCQILVGEFELKERNYVDFRTNNLGKGMNALTSTPRQTIVKIVLLMSFNKDGFGIKWLK